MASFSNCFGVVSLAVLLSFFFIYASASTKFIDGICKHVDDKAFCVKTLNAYPPAASATNEMKAAQASLRLVISHAKKCMAFAGKAAKENPNLKKQFKETQDAFMKITYLKSTIEELKEDPETANYDVMICFDSTTIVKNLVGKNTDRASKAVMAMTLMMDNLLRIAIGATEAVGA